MSRFISLLICFLLSFYLFSQSEKAYSLRPNVVAISAEGEKGFGFITGERDQKLFIVTAAHVVENALEANQNVEVKFFSDYNSYKANIVRYYLEVDVALLVVNKPFNFSWIGNCLGVATVSDNVAFIGREQNWYVPTGRALGTINNLQNNVIEVDITSITVGTAGAPLIAESGIVGMVVETTGFSTRAVDLGLLRSVLSEYDFFFTLTGTGLNSPNSNGKADIEAIYKDISAFKIARQKDEISAYQTYIRDFPNGEFKNKAIAKIQQIENQRENAFWKMAITINDETIYTIYLERYPEGKYLDQARKRIEELSTSSRKQPNLEFPLPQPTCTDQIPLNYLGITSDSVSLETVKERLVIVLDSCGYFEKRFFGTPDNLGFAISTRLERINKQGFPKDPRFLVGRKKLDVTNFKLSEYLKELFFAKPGRYRIIMFLFSEYVEFEKGKPENNSKNIRDQVFDAGSPNLNFQYSKKAVPSNRYKLNVLVYEFEHSRKSGEVNFLVESAIQGRDHIKAAGIWSSLSANKKP